MLVLPDQLKENGNEILTERDFEQIITEQITEEWIFANKIEWVSLTQYKEDVRIYIQMQQWNRNTAILLQKTEKYCIDESKQNIKYTELKEIEPKVFKCLFDACALMSSKYNSYYLNEPYSRWDQRVIENDKQLVKELRELCLRWIKLKRILLTDETFGAMSLSKKKWSIFLSHQRDDKGMVRIFNQSLIEKVKSKNFFLDEDDIKRSEDPSRIIQHGLIDCENGLIFITEKYLRSKWCVFEFFVLLCRYDHQSTLQDTKKRTGCFDIVLEEPDRDYKLFIETSIGNNFKFWVGLGFENGEIIDFLNKIPLPRVIPSSHLPSARKEVEQLQKLKTDVLKEILPNVENWVFVITPHDLETTWYKNTNRAVGIAQIIRKDGLFSSINSFTILHHWVSDFEDLSGVNSLNVEYIDDKYCIRLKSDGCITLGVPHHGISEGSIIIGIKRYKVFAARGKFLDTNALLEDAEFVLVSKFPYLKHISEFCRDESKIALVCIAGIDPTAEKFAKMFSIICDDIISLGTRYLNLHGKGIILALYKIFNWRVMIWFEQSPEEEGSVGRAVTLNPNIVLYLSLIKNPSGEISIESFQILKQPSNPRLSITLQNDANQINQMLNYWENFSSYCLITENHQELLDSKAVQLNQHQEKIIQNTLFALISTFRQKIDAVYYFEFVFQNISPRIAIIHPLIWVHSLLSVQIADSALSQNDTTKFSYFFITFQNAIQETLMKLPVLLKKLNIIPYIPLVKGSTKLYVQPITMEANIRLFVISITLNRNQTAPFFGMQVSSCYPISDIPAGYVRSDVMYDLICNTIPKSFDSVHSSGPPNVLQTMVSWIYEYSRLSNNKKRTSLGHPVSYAKFIQPILMNPSSGQQCNLKHLPQRENANPYILLCGESGMGKSTILQMLSFLLPSYSLRSVLLPEDILIEKLKILPNDLLTNIIMELCSFAGYSQNDFTFDNNNPVKDLDDWLQTNSGEEHRGLLFVVMVNVFYNLIHDSNLFLRYWNKIQDVSKIFQHLESLPKKFEELTLLQYIIGENDSVPFKIPLSKNGKWLAALAMSSYFCTDGWIRPSVCSIAFYVSFFQLEFIISEYFNQGKETFDRILLKFHMHNLKLVDSSQNPEETTLFESYLWLMRSPFVRRTLLIDDVESGKVIRSNRCNLINLLNSNNNKFQQIILTASAMDNFQESLPVQFEKWNICKWSDEQLRQYIVSFNQSSNLFPILKEQSALMCSVVCNLANNRIMPTAYLPSHTGSPLYAALERFFLEDIKYRCSVEEINIQGIIQHFGLEWVIRMLSLFAYIIYIFPRFYNTPLVEVYGIAFLFQQFRVENFLHPNLSKVTGWFEKIRNSIFADKISNDAKIDEILVLWCANILGSFCNLYRLTRNPLEDSIHFHNQSFLEYLVGNFLAESAQKDMLFPRLASICICHHRTLHLDTSLKSFFFDKYVNESIIQEAPKKQETPVIFGEKENISKAVALDAPTKQRGRRKLAKAKNITHETLSLNELVARRQLLLLWEMKYENKEWVATGIITKDGITVYKATGKAQKKVEAQQYAACQLRNMIYEVESLETDQKIEKQEVPFPVLGSQRNYPELFTKNEGNIPKPALSAQNSTVPECTRDDDVSYYTQSSLSYQMRVLNDLVAKKNFELSWDVTAHQGHEWIARGTITKDGVILYEEFAEHRKKIIAENRAAKKLRNRIFEMKGLNYEKGKQKEKQVEPFISKLNELEFFTKIEEKIPTQGITARASTVSEPKENPNVIQHPQIISQQKNKPVNNINILNEMVAKEKFTLLWDFAIHQNNEWIAIGTLCKDDVVVCKEKANASKKREAQQNAAKKICESMFIDSKKGIKFTNKSHHVSYRSKLEDYCKLNRFKIRQSCRREHSDYRISIKLVDSKGKIHAVAISLEKTHDKAVELAAIQILQDLDEMP